jgi:hypothetical protein
MLWRLYKSCLVVGRSMRNAHSKHTLVNKQMHADAARQAQHVHDTRFSFVVLFSQALYRLAEYEGASRTFKVAHALVHSCSMCANTERLYRGCEQGER